MDYSKRINGGESLILSWKCATREWFSTRMCRQSALQFVSKAFCFLLMQLLLFLLLPFPNFQKQFRRIAVEEGAGETLETLTHLPELTCDFGEVVGKLAVLLFTVTTQIEAAGASPLGDHRLIRRNLRGGGGRRRGKGRCSLRPLQATRASSSLTYYLWSS